MIWMNTYDPPLTPLLLVVPSLPFPSGTPNSGCRGRRRSRPSEGVVMSKKFCLCVAGILVNFLLVAAPLTAAVLGVACEGDCARIRAAIAAGHRPDRGDEVASLGRGYSSASQECVDGGSGCIAF